MLQIFAGPLAAHTKKEETMSDAPVVLGVVPGVVLGVVPGNKRSVPELRA
jgi:hypothetical protein